MKAVFDSEKAALKFIEYNSLDIVENGGYAPQRAYYCDLCCGWHVTSHKFHNHKTKKREVLDRYIEFERGKQGREEQMRLLQKIEQQEQRRQQRKLNRKMIPSNSPVAPFLTLSMSLALDAMIQAKVQHFNEARELVEKSVSLLNKAMNISGATSTKNTFNTCLNAFSKLLDSETAPDTSSLDAISMQFTSLIDLNESIFSYDPNVEGAHHFEITPDNYDDIMNEREAREREAKERTLQKRAAKLQEQQGIVERKLRCEGLIDLAHDEIILGDTDDARKHLFEAISIIENMKDNHCRDLLIDDLKEVMEMLPDV